MWTLSPRQQISLKEFVSHFDEEPAGCRQGDPGADTPAIHEMKAVTQVAHWSAGRLHPAWDNQTPYYKSTDLLFIVDISVKHTECEFWITFSSAIEFSVIL
ncbi:hypothetical protein XENORESO_014878 [Xenotaenia resolanae]|uniref:Uncharacterized protein n=1 Tax=Xenotaenia resolanae TaxID=208358 RepID=A0ABV0XAE9_9TELE